MYNSRWKVSVAPVLIVQTKFRRISMRVMMSTVEDRCPTQIIICGLFVTSDSIALSGSVVAFQLFITSRQKNRRKKMKETKMLFRSSILIAFVLLNGTTTKILLLLLLLLLLIYANLACCWKHVSSPPRWGSKTLSCLAACRYFSLRFLFSHDTTRIAANLNGNIYLSNLSNYLTIYRICLLIDTSVFACADSTQIANAKGECNCKKIFIHSLP